jgi:hypothetical protein
MAVFKAALEWCEGAPVAYPTTAYTLRHVEGVCGQWLITAGFQDEAREWLPNLVIENDDIDPRFFEQDHRGNSVPVVLWSEARKHSRYEAEYRRIDALTEPDPGN